MDVTPLIRSGSQVIQSYAGGVFRVSGQVFETAIIVTPERVFPWEGAGGFADLKPDDFFSLTRSSQQMLGSPSPLREREGKVDFDILLLGTGKTMQFLKPDLRKSLKDMGLSPEAMDTGAACRTYNVLMAEGRRVAAAMLPFL